MQKSQLPMLNRCGSHCFWSLTFLLFFFFFFFFFFLRFFLVWFGGGRSSVWTVGVCVCSDCVVADQCARGESRGNGGLFQD